MIQIYGFKQVRTGFRIGCRRNRNMRTNLNHFECSTRTEHHTHSHAHTHTHTHTSPTSSIVTVPGVLCIDCCFGFSPYTECATACVQDNTHTTAFRVEFARLSVGAVIAFTSLALPPFPANRKKKKRSSCTKPKTG